MNNHNKAIASIITFIRGETLLCKLSLVGFGVCVVSAGSGVSVSRDVLVGAGNTKVISGKGINVVVGVIEGVNVGVSVCEGALNVAVSVWEKLSTVGVTVERS